MKNWLLFGFKGCGKTTLGKKLAEKAGRLFVDLDACIEESYGSLSCREIALKEGEAFFRELESNTLRCLSLTNAVLALGGGTLLFHDNLKVAQLIGQLIYLKADKSSLKERFLTPPLPSYIDLTNPHASFEKIYSQRILEYEKIPSLYVHLNGKNLEENFNLLWEAIDSAIYSVSPPGEKPMEKPLESSSMAVPQDSSSQKIAFTKN